MKTTLDLGSLFRTYGPAYRQKYQSRIPRRHLKAMHDIEACRTPVLGGQIFTCDTCHQPHFVYHSCRNRHCPLCQGMPMLEWVEKRKRDLLPIPYFHVVFTLPEQLQTLALKNQTVVYNILFKAASQTLKTLAADPKYLGAQIGFIGVLHTWTQTMAYHPHIHCIVTGGGLSLNGQKWISAKDDFFIPVRVLSRLFRGKFLAFLKQAHQDQTLTLSKPQLSSDTDFKKLIDSLYRREWVVYCKPPFGSAKHVLEYLGRYTQRIAISNSRILDVQNDRVYFTYRDRKNGDQVTTMSLPIFEFFRRFLTHVLPKDFVKIRHFGLLANRNRKTALAICRKQLCLAPVTQTESTPPRSWQERVYQLTGKDPMCCPHCNKGRLIFKATMPPDPERAPPG